MRRLRAEMSDTNKFLYYLSLEDGLYRSKDGITWEKWKEAE